MKTYQIERTAGATQDVDDHVFYLLRVELLSLTGVDRWVEGLETAISALSDRPRRFPLIPEYEDFRIELRQFVYHSHRVIFHVDDASGVVHVLRIFHGKRERLTKSDLN